MEQCIQQNTAEWLKARLGNFTASAVHQLMQSGRGKDELFGKTALTYIREVAAERDLLPAYIEDDILFEVYTQQTSFSNKATEWGHETEPLAAERYALLTGFDTEECGIFAHPSVERFSASPDRIATDPRSGAQVVVEIKCPSPKTFVEYRECIHDAAELKAVRPEYYWQVQAEMACTGLRSAHFVAFCPFLRHHITIVPVAADDEAIALMLERVRAANRYIDEHILLTDKNSDDNESDRKNQPDAA